MGLRRNRATGHRLHERCRRLLREKDEEILKLRRRVEQLELKVEKLIALLKQNSKNSSRPPSSDRYQSQEKRTPSERSPGGQPNHPGSFRALIPQEKINHVIVLKPSHCMNCGQELFGEDGDPFRHQVTELPPIKPMVHEYQLHRLVCPRCGKKAQATLPSDISTGAFGPHIQAIAATARSVYHLSKHTTKDLFRDLLGVSISSGSLSALEKTTSRALTSPIQKALAYARKQKNANTDETGWKEKGKQAWLWTLVTKHVSVFKIQKKRNRKAMKKLLGHFDGILGSDRYSAYAEFEPSKRQICWAHLLRDFTAMLDRGKASEKIGKDLMVTTHAMFHKWHSFKQEKISREFFQKEMERIQEVILGLLNDGSLCADDKTAKVCRNLLHLKEALFTFVRLDGIEPTNNAAEQALRWGVIWRKIGLGSQSETGSRFAERMMTVQASLKQQGRNILDYLTQVCQAALRKDPIPSLVPQAILRE